MWPYYIWNRNQDLCVYFLSGSGGSRLKWIKTLVRLLVRQHHQCIQLTNITTNKNGEMVAKHFIFWLWLDLSQSGSSWQSRLAACPPLSLSFSDVGLSGWGRCYSLPFSPLTISSCISAHPDPWPSVSLLLPEMNWELLTQTSETTDNLDNTSGGGEKFL